MPEARMLQLPTQVQPTIGGGGRLPGKVLAWQGVVALVLILLLGVAKHVVAARESGPDQLSALPGGRTVTVGLDIGGAPTDYDLQALAASYQVDGVVNLSGPNVAEQVTTTSLNLGYLRSALASDAAPTLTQLHMLASFMQRYSQGSGSVYLHDDVGGGRAVATVGMLLLLRGETWPKVQQAMTTVELQSLSIGQSRAIKQLISALHSNDQPRRGNPYSGARIDPW